MGRDIVRMQVTKKQLGEIKLMGIMARTNNAAEMDPSSARISPTVQKYFHEGWADRFPNRTKPGVTYSAYTDYESDITGDYTYFIGEEVSSFDNVPDGASTLVIPAQHYAVFTNGPGPMPGVCIETWQHIWGLTAEEMGGERNYLADFELYDERATDHTRVTLDIFIGVKK